MNTNKQHTCLFSPANCTVSQHKLASILDHSTIPSKLDHLHADMCGQGIGVLEIINIVMFNNFFDKAKNIVSYKND